MPRYKLTERAYFDRLYQPDEEIETDLKPGPHMEPLDAAAKKAKAEAGAYADPITSLPIGTTGSTNNLAPANFGPELVAGITSAITAGMNAHTEAVTAAVVAAMAVKTPGTEENPGKDDKTDA